MNTLKTARMVLHTFVPQRRTPDPRHAIPEADKDLSGKTVVFTGGTDGMGRVAVEALYRMGADVILLGRSEKKARAAVDEITASPGGTMLFESCDLSSMQSVRACAKRVLTKHDTIDILVNCAGANFQERKVSSEGLELNWAVNYLGPYLLTQLLLPALKTAEHGRIVNLSSETEANGHINFEDLQREKDWSSLKSYAQAKLAINIFTIELAKSLKDTNITVNALNPGYIQSNLLRELKGAQGLFRYFMRVFASPAEVGADRIARLAVSSQFEGVTGKFVSEDKITAPNPEALDSNIRQRLMSVSESAVAEYRIN